MYSMSGKVILEIDIFSVKVAFCYYYVHFLLIINKNGYVDGQY